MAQSRSSKLLKEELVKYGIDNFELVLSKFEFRLSKDQKKHTMNALEKYILNRNLKIFEIFIILIKFKKFNYFLLQIRFYLPHYVHTVFIVTILLNEVFF